jgi:multiple sugar transport system substrate-binding protein
MPKTQAQKMRLLICAAALLFIFGCATERNADEQQVNSAGPVRLIFKHHKVAGDPKYLRELLDRLEAENPNLKVEEQTLPASSDRQHQFYVTNLEARSADFDVFALDVIWPPEFARAGAPAENSSTGQKHGWLLDLTPYFSEVDFA